MSWLATIVITKSGTDHVFLARRLALLTVVNRPTAATAQPPIVRQFSYNMEFAGAQQVIQPWMTYNLINPANAGSRANLQYGFLENIGQTTDEATHWDHFHVRTRY